MSGTVFRVTEARLYNSAAGSTLIATNDFTHDAAGSVTELKETTSATTVADYSMTYDAVEELTNQIDHGSTTSFAYDVLGQLATFGFTTRGGRATSGLVHRMQRGGRTTGRRSPTARCIMKCAFCLVPLLVIMGCRIADERDALRPLPDKGNPLTYADLFQRAKLQANAALDAFYTDNWLELEQTAQVLEQTAGHLPKSSEQPKEIKQKLAEEAATLKQQAGKLRDAAKAKSVQDSNESLRRIHLTIRSLRPPE